MIMMRLVFRTLFANEKSIYGQRQYSINVHILDSDSKAAPECIHLLVVVSQSTNERRKTINAFREKSHGFCDE